MNLISTNIPKFARLFGIPLDRDTSPAESRRRSLRSVEAAQPHRLKVRHAPTGNPGGNAKQRRIARRKLARARLTSVQTTE